MDESWRMRMGMPTAPSPTAVRKLPNYPRRRSTEDIARRNPIPDDPLNPEDFSDVFGGPPRTVLSRQFSTGFPRSSSSSTGYFYEEVFQPPEKAPPPQRVCRAGRSLPEFRIPGRQRASNRNQQRPEKDDFYSDIFGYEDERLVRSRSRSKASSSSVLSSEELSPLRPAFSVDGEDDVSFFASKLRPINVRSRWASRTMVNEDHQRKENMMPPFSGIQNPEKDCPDDLRSYAFGLSRRNGSPDTISLEPIPNSSFRASADDLELNSPSSAVSSVCPSDREHKGCQMDSKWYVAMEQEEDEVMSSYVIEIDCENREGACGGSNGVDEAIAWAKQKFQTQSSESKGSLQDEVEKTTEEMMNVSQFSEVETEMQILDEKIKLWSTGKEADIRLLLSSLHHILWPNNGWSPVSLADVIELSHVKRAYQKARLCLHPDKLQQRGATLPQKYIAEKAFSVLQDAWAAFISQDVV